MNLEGKKLNLREMKKIAHIIVDWRKMYRDDLRILCSRKEASPTENFFDFLLDSTYNEKDSQNGIKCSVLSFPNDSNLVLAYLDFDVIHIVSENSILSPTQFANVLTSIQEACMNTELYIRRNDPHNANVGLFNAGFLRVNHANVKLATESSTKVHCHFLENGICLLNFINEICQTNPDMKLLFSNVNCWKSPISVRQAVMNALGKCYDKSFIRGTEVDEDILEYLKRNPGCKDDEEFLQILGKEKSILQAERTRTNTEFDIYPILQGIIPNFDGNYLLTLDDHFERDNAHIDILKSLSVMQYVAQRESDANIHAPRTLPEVKQYFKILENRALELECSEKSKVQNKEKSYTED